MALFPLSGVLRGFTQRKNDSFMNWTPFVQKRSSRMDINDLYSEYYVTISVQVYDIIKFFHRAEKIHEIFGLDLKG